MNINFGAFIDNLYYMGVGMLCIFIVIGVIILSVLLLQYVSKAASKRKEAKESAQSSDEDK